MNDDKTQAQAPCNKAGNAARWNLIATAGLALCLLPTLAGLLVLSSIRAGSIDLGFFLAPNAVLSFVGATLILSPVIKRLGLRLFIGFFLGLGVFLVNCMIVLLMACSA